MSLSRLFVAAALGVVVAVAFFVRGETTPSVGKASTTVAHENIAERSLELQGRDIAASAGGWSEDIAERTLELHDRNLAANVRGWENIAERNLELHGANIAATVGGWRENIAERTLELHDRQSAAGNAKLASAAPARDNITERTLALQDQIAALRAATAQFQRTDAARAAGYTLVSGLDYCFSNPGVGGMGFHLIKTSSLDLTVNALEPEAMVYAPGPNGQFQLGAVEFIVPAAAWDAAGNTQPPSVLGQSFHLNSALGVYILHAWIWRDNPLGIFQDWNPKVSCR